MRTDPPRGLLHCAGVVLGAVALAWMFPAVMGTGWADILGTLLTVSALPLAGLVGLWAVGKLAHSITLSAAMPGLDCRRALMLSLTGSAVANVLPLGGAAGIALNYRMSRGWGFTSAAVATYTVVVNLCDVMVKLFLPLALIPLVLGGHLPTPFDGSLIISTVALLALAGATAIVLLTASRGLGARLAARAERSARPGGWLLVTRALAGADQVSSLSRATFGRSWSRLSTGMCLYTVLLLVLLAACLRIVGAGVPIALIVAAFSVERLLTLVGITPAGFGVVELGLAGVLMLAPAVTGPDVASGILLYRLLTVGLGIPVGGALLALWLWRNQQPRLQPAALTS